MPMIISRLFLLSGLALILMALTFTVCPSALHAQDFDEEAFPGDFPHPGESYPDSELPEEYYEHEWSEEEAYEDESYDSYNAEDYRPAYEPEEIERRYGPSPFVPPREPSSTQFGPTVREQTEGGRNTTERSKDPVAFYLLKEDRKERYGPKARVKTKN